MAEAAVEQRCNIDATGNFHRSSWNPTTEDQITIITLTSFTVNIHSLSSGKIHFNNIFISTFLIICIYSVCRTIEAGLFLVLLKQQRKSPIAVLYHCAFMNYIGLHGGEEVKMKKSLVSWCCVCIRTYPGPAEGKTNEIWSRKYWKHNWKRPKSVSEKQDQTPAFKHVYIITR